MAASFKDPNQTAIIIGAGAAGLACAKQLVRHGWSVLILEGRSRLGGRICSIQPPDGNPPLDLGPEFVHGPAPELKHLSLGKEAKIIKLKETREVCWHKQLHRNKDFWKAIDEGMAKLADMKGEMPVVEALREIRPQISEMNFALLKDYIESFNAVDVNMLSLRAFNEENQRAGDLQSLHRIVPDDGAIVKSLTRDLEDPCCEIRLRHHVKKIRWRRGGVQIISQGPGGERTDCAAAVVVTIPPSVFADDLLHPAVPEKAAAVKMMDMGPVWKVVHVFHQPLWRTEENIHFLQSPQLTFGTRWSWGWMKPFVVTSWAGGGSVEALRGRGKDEVIRQALHDMSASTGISYGEVMALHKRSYYHDWVSDPYIRGAYSSVKVGGFGAREKLAAPVEKTLYFAGEATCADGSAGTVHGAIRSGVRAARECMHDHSWWGRISQVVGDKFRSQIEIR